MASRVQLVKLEHLDELERLDLSERPVLLEDRDHKETQERLVQQVSLGLLEAMEHQDLPETLVQRVKLERPALKEELGLPELPVQQDELVLLVELVRLDLLEVLGDLAQQAPLDRVVSLKTDRN